MKRRGYLDPLLELSIYEMNYGVLEDWVGWLYDAKPKPSAKIRKHALDAVKTCSISSLIVAGTGFLDQSS